MLAGLFWNQWSFLVLFSIIHFGCWWEYFRLLEKIRSTVFHPYTKLGFMVLGYSLVLWCCRPFYSISGYGLQENLVLPVSAAGFVMLMLGIFQKGAINLRSFGAAALGILYISLSCGMMINLYGVPVHMPVLFDGSPFYFNYFPVVLILCMWINDTMAYIVGSLIGRTPFSAISPKKTWEGTIGGILLCSGIVGYAGFWFDTWDAFGKDLFFWICLALIAAITGTAGDLLESKLKRMAGVKDSGRIMPGHGGFLDRFDSLLLAIPFVWLYLLFLPDRV